MPPDARQFFDVTFCHFSPYRVSAKLFVSLRGGGLRQPLDNHDMTEAQIKEHLKRRGYPNSVWKGGSEGLVRRWEKFVAEVEKGYWPCCLIDEYWNDLDTRDVIHEVGCDDRVREADERLRTMLTATEIRHRRRDREADYDFWNRGYPKNASGFFLEQIQRFILRRSPPVRA